MEGAVVFSALLKVGELPALSFCLQSDKNPVGGWGITHTGMRNRTKSLDPTGESRQMGIPAGSQASQPGIQG